VPVGPNLFELVLPIVGDDLFLVQSFEVLVKARPRVCLLLEFDLPDVADYGFE
jgi:hypothetical protein